MGNWYEKVVLTIARSHLGHDVKKTKIGGKLPRNVVTVINDIIENLDGGKPPNFFEESKQIRKGLNAPSKEIVTINPIMIDFFAPNVNGTVFAAELKTPKANKSIFKGEQRKMLQVRALLMSQIRDKSFDKFHTCFVFSYNPYTTWKTLS